MMHLENHLGPPNLLLGPLKLPFMTLFLPSYRNRVSTTNTVNQSTVDDGGVSRASSVAVCVSDMWKVICNT